MLIDFKEIPLKNSESALADSFELFARDFLELQGYKIIQEPFRGADGKKDLIVREARKGINGLTNIDWLVSCKHNANSGKSVSDIDEPNLTDRVDFNNCQGFISFCSTIISSSLSGNLEALKRKYEVLIFDREKIEAHIVGNQLYDSLFKRYCPNSFKKWKDLDNYREPVKLFSFIVDKYYSDITTIIKKVFNDDYGFFIKSIRKSENIYELFKIQEVEIVKEEILNKWLEMSSDEMKYFKDYPEVVKNLGNCWTYAVPYEFKKIPFEKVKDKLICWGHKLSVEKDHNGEFYNTISYPIQYFLYKNHFVVSDGGEEYFEKLFFKLKSLID
ncbi:hypothetical protein [Adhaeribacter terreus]|uniref:Restriction endonuclease n=1 Tax=Adhaeribacter terreus TaxID=529703 RepID=A0ABW0E7V5_9BACT